MLKFWAISGRFAIILGRFDRFQIVSASVRFFWLVPGFSKYNVQFHYRCPQCLDGPLKV